MAIKTPASMIAAWQAGLAAKGAAYKNGIDTCAVNPMAMAAAQVQKFEANFIAAVPRWAQKMAQASVQYWKDQSKLAAAKWSMGATKGLPKYTKFANQAAPVYAAMKSASMNAGSSPLAKVTAALSVLMAAGRKQGGTAFT